MTDRVAPAPRRFTGSTGERLVSTVVREYQWIHIGLGLLGNTCFVLGSVFFLHESLKLPGTWLFVVGSLGMLVGSVGSAIVRFEERRVRDRPGADRPQRSEHTADEVP